MKTLKPTIAVAAVSLVALAGCAQNATDTVAEQATNAQQQAQKQASSILSPEAQGLLERTQGLAADIAGTAKAYTGDDITRQRAMKRLDKYLQLADELAVRARTVPATERTRSSLRALLDQMRSTGRDVRSQTESGAAAANDQASIDDPPEGGGEGLRPIAGQGAGKGAAARARRAGPPRPARRPVKERSNR